MLKEIVEAELQKLLKVDFIYPISNSQWYLLQWLYQRKIENREYSVNYRELNKTTLKDQFPMPFIDQVLDTLARNKFFSFLDGFNGYNHIKIAL